MKYSILQSKTTEFSLSTINFLKETPIKKFDYILCEQLLRSATSIGANVQEGIGGYSEKDFYYKLNLSYKEALESRYWLNLMTHIFPNKRIEIDTLNEQCIEIIKILYTILNKTKN